MIYELVEYIDLEITKLDWRIREAGASGDVASGLYGKKQVLLEVLSEILTLVEKRKKEKSVYMTVLKERLRDA